MAVCASFTSAFGGDALFGKRLGGDDVCTLDSESVFFSRGTMVCSGWLGAGLDCLCICFDHRPGKKLVSVYIDLLHCDE